MSSFKLKLIAISTMLIDHIGVILFPNILWLRLIGRLAFPLFLLAILAFIIDSSYNVYGVLLIYVIHITRNNIKKMFGYFSLLHVIYYLVLLVLPYYNFKTFLMQFPALLTIILFKFYNGKLGYSAKNFFYLFYPVHLLVLVFIEKITK